MMNVKMPKNSTSTVNIILQMWQQVKEVNILCLMIIDQINKKNHQIFLKIDHYEIF
jgi:hypothetical protein